MPAETDEFMPDELVGAVPLRVEGTQLWLKTPPRSLGGRSSPPPRVRPRDYLPARPEYLVRAAIKGWATSGVWPGVVRISFEDRALP